MAAAVQEQGQEAERTKAEAEKAKANVDTAIANLKTEQARFDAHIAQAEARLMQRDLQGQAKGMQAEQGQSQEREQIIGEIVQQAMAFQQQAAQALEVILQEQARTGQLVEAVVQQAMAPPPPAEPKQFKMTRGPDGSLMATYGNKQAIARRNPNGELDGEITTIQ